MNVYVYQAALLCEECGNATMEELNAAFKDNDVVPGNPLNDDSERYPQGPYNSGGGEADCPQHCDHCNLFLENPLTDDGREYIREAIESHTSDVTQEWDSFYNT